MSNFTPAQVNTFRDAIKRGSLNLSNDKVGEVVRIVKACRTTERFTWQTAVVIIDHSDGSEFVANIISRSLMNKIGTDLSVLLDCTHMPADKSAEVGRVLYELYEVGAIFFNVNTGAVMTQNEISVIGTQNPDTMVMVEVKNEEK